jgi:hypothetical protein
LARRPQNLNLGMRSGIGTSQHAVPPLGDKPLAVDKQRPDRNLTGCFSAARQLQGPAHPAMVVEA